VPFVRITVFGPAFKPEQIQKLQRGATDLMTSGMRKPLVGTSVLVEQVASGSWSIANDAVKLAAHVEVIIGAGTNSAAEKAQFMSEMMGLLRAVLGPELRDETYIVIHEMDTGSYGRGGLTRAERERRKQAVPA
jgi:4-oxalocrotonate tautomerase